MREEERGKRERDIIGTQRERLRERERERAREREREVSRSKWHFIAFASCI